MPFQPGQSGNPAGRPRGARNKATILLETVVERDGEDLLRQFIGQAREGDTRALAHLMGIILPKRHGALIELDLSPLEEAADAPVAIAAIISAVCRGELTPAEGITLTRMVEAFMRAKQNVGKLERKLQRLADAAAAAAAKVREAPEPPVSAQAEAPSANSATVQAQHAMQAAEPNAHAPATEALGALVKGLPSQSLARLRREALSGTSPLAPSAVGGGPIVSSLFNPLDSAVGCEETRAAA